MTRLFDPHIHMYSRTTDDYDAMSKAGIEVIVQPSFWLGSPRTSVGTFEDYWEHMITFETKRAKEFGIDHFVCISVNPKETEERPLALDAIEAMKKYFDRERVVAVGELGYNLINDLEEEAFLKQVDIAVQKDMLMTIHLPHYNKVEGMKRIDVVVFQIDVVVCLILFACIIIITFKRTIFQDYSSIGIQRAIKTMVLSIIVLDSVFVSGTAGLYYGLATLLLIIPSIVLARELYVTWFLQIGVMFEYTKLVK
jgi:hypothetical protein